ncbi:hypothetical protein BaRGS_00006965, partial [Batillaria attramentaria]
VKRGVTILVVPVCKHIHAGCPPSLGRTPVSDTGHCPSPRRLPVIHFLSGLAYRLALPSFYNIVRQSQTGSRILFARHITAALSSRRGKKASHFSRYQMTPRDVTAEPRTGLVCQQSYRDPPGLKHSTGLLRGSAFRPNCPQRNATVGRTTQSTILIRPPNPTF